MGSTEITQELHNDIMAFFRKYLTNDFNNKNKIAKDALELYSELKIQNDPRFKFTHFEFINGLRIERSDAKFLEGICNNYHNDKIPIIKYIKCKYGFSLRDAKSIVDYF